MGKQTLPAHQVVMQRKKRVGRVQAESDPDQVWMADKLKETGLAWSPQAIWGSRIFDFWNHGLGTAIVLVEAQPNSMLLLQETYALPEDASATRNAIVVLRVRKGNEEDAAAVLQRIATSQSWNDRRGALGLKAMWNAG